jgi:ABC-type transport system involved in cytochrome bd biosynthesis fused ATPase/permease subunit
VKSLRSVLLSWVSGLGLAFSYLGIGRLIQQLVEGHRPTATDYAWVLLAVLVAAAAAVVVPLLGSHDQGDDEHDTRAGIIRHVFQLGSAERTRERTGRIVSTATDGTERAAAYRSTFIAPTIGSMTTPVLVLLLVGLFISWPIAGWLAIAVPAIPVALGAFQMLFRKVSSAYRASGRVLSAQFLDAIQGLPELSLMNAGKRMGAKLAEAAESLRQHVMKLLAGNQLMLFVVDSLFSLAFIVGATWLGLDRLSEGVINVGQAISLVLLATLLLEPLDRIGQFFYIGMGGIASAKEIRSFLAEKPAVVDAPDAIFPGRLDPQAPAIEFEDVRFAYDPQVPVLNGVSFRVEPGEQVALAGPSGAGKTTVATLLQGEARPTGGTIRVFGQDIAGVQRSWLRGQLSVVAQHTYLFTGTLRQNLHIAKPGADDMTLLKALVDADLGKFFDELPDGLDTVLGERGMALSGGQAQRVGIARAFLKDAPILVLDEPTSQVDLSSERTILRALHRLAAGRTVLSISHRKATLLAAERRIELSDGRIAVPEVSR